MLEPFEHECYLYLMQPQSPWAIRDFIVQPQVIVVGINDDWKNNIELKRQFAIALAEGNNPFESACIVFGKETNKALWASQNWINDPIVTETKQEYTEIATPKRVLLDKDALSLRLLTFSEEKLTYNGNEIYAAEAKDRLAALKLYAEICGFINNKTEINNNNFNTKNNFMEIKFVEPEKKEKEIKVIDHQKIQEENILETSPIKLKLVG